jgi:Leucine-rich repeat (LRR) protein
LAELEVMPEGLTEQLAVVVDGLEWTMRREGGGRLRVFDDDSDEQTSLFSIYELRGKSGALSYRCVVLNDEDGRVFVGTSTAVFAELSQGGLAPADRRRTESNAPALDALYEALPFLSGESSATALPARSGDGPATLADWLATYPEPAAQDTCRAILRGLSGPAGDGRGGFMRFCFEQDHGIPPHRQPDDPYEFLCAAKSLWLTNNSDFEGVILTDLRPLAVFTQLTDLKVSVAEDTPLAPLAQLCALEQMYIRGGERSDWSYLSSLQRLEELTVALHRDSFREKVPAPRLSLAGLHRLRTFKWNGHFDDISHVAFPSELVEISLNGNIEDASPLAGLANLTELSLSGNRLRNVAPLASLTNLTVLKLGRNKIRDISPLFALERLGRLDVSDNLISDLTGIEQITGLYDLDADDNEISDFKPIRKWLANDPEEADEWISMAKVSQRKPGAG